eukprot:scaffold83417_cov33-Attheya_sp.AAC.1
MMMLASTFSFWILVNATMTLSLLTTTMAHHPREEGKRRKSSRKLHVGKSGKGVHGCPCWEEKQLKVATEEWNCDGGGGEVDGGIRLINDADADFGDLSIFEVESDGRGFFDGSLCASIGTRDNSDKPAVFYTFLTTEEESTCVEQLTDRCDKLDIWETDETGDTPVEDSFGAVLKNNKGRKGPGYSHTQGRIEEGSRNIGNFIADIDRYNIMCCHLEEKLNATILEKDASEMCANELVDEVSSSLSSELLESTNQVDEPNADNNKITSRN